MKLFSPFRMREIELKNRIVVSPMCEYSAKDGHPQPWHLVHLGSRAIGGAALVFTEASAVEERGRISSADTGIYEDAHVDSWRPIAEFIRSHGAVPGMQLAHAGRKASTAPPWTGGKPVSVQDGGWEPVGPSAIAFDPAYTMPRELSAAEIAGIVAAFASRQNAPWRLASKLLKFTPRTATCSTNFCRRSRTRTDDYGGHSRIECAYR